MQAGSIIQDKLERLRSGQPPRVLDLFAGCGGLSLGFIAAGCRSVGGVESDPDAARSFAYNLHPEDTERHGRPRTAEQSSAEILASLGLEGPQDVDIIVGGPPCPAFSRIGRAKLNFRHDPRKVDKATSRQPGLFLEDPRAELYIRFLDHVEAMQPVAVLMENVPEFLNHGGQNLGEACAARLHALGYSCAYTLLNAAAYGVPQWRERFFLLAVHSSTGVDVPAFPAPAFDTSVMPRGMRLNSKAALRRVPSLTTVHAGQISWVRNDFWVPTPRPSADLPPPVSAGQAISDLPPYAAHHEILFTRRNSYWEEIEWLPAAEGPVSGYVRALRDWPGLPPFRGIPKHHHLTRHTTSQTGRDTSIFRLMKEGDEFPDAIVIAKRLLDRKTQAEEERLGRPLSDPELDQLRRACLPPYDDSKFPNKWWKLCRDEPARTLTAHLGKDSYSHIHHDSGQARMITVQEAARLQSFPDAFVFRTSMNGAFRQIGNSVPPLLAWSIAHTMLSQMARAGIEVSAIAPPLSSIANLSGARN